MERKFSLAAVVLLMFTSASYATCGHIKPEAAIDARMVNYCNIVAEQARSSYQKIVFDRCLTNQQLRATILKDDHK